MRGYQINQSRRALNDGLRTSKIVNKISPEEINRQSNTPVVNIQSSAQLRPRRRFGDSMRPKRTGDELINKEATSKDKLAMKNMSWGVMRRGFWRGKEIQRRTSHRMMEKGWVTDVLQRGWVKDKGWVANREWVTISGSDIADYAAAHVCAWPECGRAFGSEEEYKIHHLLAHHGDAAYQCPICRMDLPHSTALNAHWELHHRGTRHCICPVPECTKVLVEDETAIIHVLDHADPKGAQRQEYRQMRDQFFSSGIAVAFMAYYTGLYNPAACISIMLTHTPGI